MAVGPLLTIFRSLGSLGSAATAASGKVAKFADGINKVGGAVASIQQVGGVIQTITTKLAGLTTPLSVASSMFQAAVGIAGTMGTAIVKAFSPMEPLNAAFAAFSQVANAAVGTVTALGQTVGQFVQFANPALVKDFEAATRDVMGAIGRGLLPVMTFATSVVRAFSDVVFRLSGPFQLLMRSVFDPLQAMIPKLIQDFTPLLNSINNVTKSLIPLAPLIGQVFGVFAESVGTFVEAVIRPLLNLLVTGFSALAIVMQPLVKILVDVSKSVNSFIRSVLGIKPSTDSARGEGFGAGATNVKFGGVEDFFKDAMKASFMLGSGSRQEISPEVSAINILIGQIVKFRENFATFVEWVEKTYELGKEKIREGKEDAGKAGTTAAAFAVNPVLGATVAAINYGKSISDEAKERWDRLWR